MQIGTYIQQITQLSEKQINGTLKLLGEGATVPFISRYRKGQTGGLDEVQVAAVRDQKEKFEQILDRQKSILKKIDEQEALTEELRIKIEACFDLQKLEDLYLPFKQKRTSKAEKARKLGLEPLAKMIMAQRGGAPEDMAERFMSRDVHEIEEALSGARDIMAEWMNENVALRDRLRQVFRRHGRLQSKLVKGKEEEAQTYKDYFDHEEALMRIAAHRFFAITRGEKEGVLKVKVEVPMQEIERVMDRFFIKGNSSCADEVVKAYKEAYRRLLKPSVSNELLGEVRERAETQSYNIFAENLRQLLLASPVGRKRVLAIDPGFKTGCKLVCLDENGELLANDIMYPHPPQKDQAKAKSKLSRLVEAYKIDVIAVGDGTAGRETEHFLKHMRFPKEVQVYIVREDGASIYSASPIARKEFPSFDVTVRGAVSIGRRLMDPLAELVKIDPKSLGVGSYQHEVNQSGLKKVLDDVVVSCVNAVGVDVNTASPYLLQYVSGLGPSLAENIVAYRNEKGQFESREELKQVPRMGEKAYEQAAGFLRVAQSDNPLDNSAVHPESYPLVEKMAKTLGVNQGELVGNADLLSKVNQGAFDVDAYTWKDLIEELKKPGRDPRKQATVFEFDSRLKSIDDIVVGMELPAIVTNITAFGAFVNIGIKENGLIHKSRLAEHYVDAPTTIVRLNQHLKVRVVELDATRKRIGLQKLED